MQTEFYQEIIDEIGTQTLARFGLNIFNLDTYSAYASSVTATNITTYRAKQHEKNDKAFGYNFENLDTGQENIKNALLQNGKKVYTSDDIADITSVYGMIEDKKKNLNAKDKNKFEYVKKNFSDELEKIKNGELDFSNFKKCDPNTDVVTYDKFGKVVKKEQHKVIKNTDGLLKDRYLENNDNFKVPFDDYLKHKNELEAKIKSPDVPLQTKEKAKKALDMLEKNNLTNRLMCQNPKTVAILSQGIVAGGYTLQAGLSDAVIVGLSTLANGAIFEIKDSINNPDISILERIKRLIDKVLQNFKNTFFRGVSFGAMDIIMQTLDQIFKKISSHIKNIWKNLRKNAKSIYNAICDYVNGKIKNFADLLNIIIKAIFSAIMVAFAIVLEESLDKFLSPLVTPIISSFLSPAIAIIITSIFVVSGTKMIDEVLNSCFSIYLELKK